MFESNRKIDLLKLREGNTFSLLKKEWTIKEIAEYDWRMDNTSVEYTITSSDTTAYLEIEFHKGKHEAIYSEKVNIEEAFLIDAINTEEIIFEGKRFELDETYQGDYKNLTTFSNRESLECYIFYAKDDEQITIEKWSDGSYEAFVGKEINPKKIKNIKQ